MPASSRSTAWHAAAKSLPQVVRGGKIIGRSVGASLASCEAGKAGVSLRAFSGELALSFKMSVAKTCE